NQRASDHAAPCFIASQRPADLWGACGEVGACDGDSCGDVAAAVGEHSLDWIEVERAQFRALDLGIEPPDQAAAGHVGPKGDVISGCVQHAAPFAFGHFAFAEDADTDESSLGDLAEQVAADVIRTVV